MSPIHVHNGMAPLLISIPHAGYEIPEPVAGAFESLWRARIDTDWWINLLYDFAPDIGATVVRTEISRSVIDVNRDPSGASLYPNQATTALCPTTTFDGENLYSGCPPDEEEIARRKHAYFDPYHTALNSELSRLRKMHRRIVLYDAHSIRSRIPRLFPNELPHFNIGTNSGASADPRLTAELERICGATGLSHVTNGRFKGGWITRHYGQPESGIHAVQMELACRLYLDEPLAAPTAATWPATYNKERAEAARTTLRSILAACLDFAGEMSP